MIEVIKKMGIKKIGIRSLAGFWLLMLCGLCWNLAHATSSASLGASAQLSPVASSASVASSGAAAASSSSVATTASAGVQTYGTPIIYEPRSHWSMVDQNRFYQVALVVLLLFIAWLGLVAGYYCWAIRFYNINYGLSDDEWKVLYPDIYANEKELERFLAKRNGQMLANGATGDASATGAAGLSEPEENPYQRESFGLPPGTIRGTLALTAMVAFVLIEMLNVFAPTNLEAEFGELITVFQMVIAFYFGAKAIDIFNKRQEKSVLQPESSGPQTSSAAGSPAPLAVSPSQAAVVAPLAGALSPTEGPAMPASGYALRNDHVEINRVPQEPVSGVGKLDGSTPLARRVLALTASFETDAGFPDCFAGLSGDFDKQGMSFGALQWCLGQNSLQPLWKKMLARHRDEALAALGNERLQEMEDMLTKPLADQLTWARSLQFTRANSKGKRVLVIEENWKQALVRLGLSAGMIDVQTEEAHIRYQKAIADCQEYQCRTERAVALFFDINVQNGQVDIKGVKNAILGDVAKLPVSLSGVDREVEVLRIVARRRSAVCKPEWRQDVLSRKMAIAEGKGVVHGKPYDLAADYGIDTKFAL